MGAARILPLPLMELPNFPPPFTNRSISSSSSCFNNPHYITPPPPLTLRHLPPLPGTTLRSSFLLSDHGKRRSFATLAAAASDASDEWGPEPPPPPQETVVVDGGQGNGGEVAKLKKALVDSFYGTDRGLKASSETRAEIVELITQLEALNPTPAPTEALSLLNGKWILVYTSFSELFPLLATGTLPLVKVEEVSQTIDSSNFTVENSVQLVGPLATTSLTTNAKFEIRSPKRVQIMFEQGIIGTPQLTDSIVIPENLDFLGQKIDLAPLKGLLTSVQGAASSVAKRISDQPPVKFPITSEKAQSWLLTTYLDNEFRISRGDGSSVFVLIKEGCPLLK